MAKENMIDIYMKDHLSCFKHNGSGRAGGRNGLLILVSY